MTRHLGVIDLGSNAVRMAIAEVEKDGSFRILHKIRCPIRVGRDVFSRGYITRATRDRLLRAFFRFRRHTDAYPQVTFRAVATSAFREAENGVDVAKEISKATGIKLEIINGQEEAQLIQIALNKIPQVKNHCVLLMDIGGGSIELTGMNRGKTGLSKSLPLGTVRLLQGLKKERRATLDLPKYLKEKMHSLEDFLSDIRKRLNFDYCVGTGGNFETLYQLKKKLLKKKNGGFIRQKEFDGLRDSLLSMSYTGRVRKLKLRKDRADVIVPACLLAQTVLELSQTSAFFIPKVGLRDGLIIDLIQSSP